jgi:hypothetical protein
MLLTAPSPDNVLKNADEHLAEVAHNSFYISSNNRAAMAQLRQLVDRYQFEVYLVNSPLYEGLLEDEAFQHYYADMQAQMRLYADQSEFIHFLELTAVFPADQMENVDPHHAISGDSIHRANC